MEAIGLTLGLDADPRPTCLLDVGVAADGDGEGRDVDEPLSCVRFRNAALQENEQDLLQDLLDSNHAAGLQTWTCDPNVQGPLQFTNGHSIYTYTIQDKWRVVQWTLANKVLNASENRFSNFAELANIGIWMIDLNWQMQYCNREWFAISGHPVTDPADVDWTICLDEEQQKSIDGYLKEALASNRPVQFQFEVFRTWKNDQGHEMRACVLAAAFPELDDAGTLIGFAGTLTDISDLRWAEALQKQRTDEAVEAKRQQENFIDMTCHEIRNPLGAVVHCADLVTSALTDIYHHVKPPVSASTPLESLFNSAFDSIDVITSCCAHQKRIVDDILTLSKLDAKLLTLAPAAVRFNELLWEASNLLEADAHKAGALLRIEREPSLGQVLGSKPVLLDSGRLMQVLINLVTNAFKFTRREGDRNVTVIVGASRDKPTENALGVKFIPTSSSREARPVEQNGSHQDVVFLHFKVIDTGCGFDSEKQSRIFERFEQASVRTHSQYGGSGLGLFISREMIEMQGGEIGVHSQAGKGSTFAFYIATSTAETQVSTTEEPAIRIKRPRLGSSPPATLFSNEKYTILIVEDNLVNQKVLRLQLEKLGHEVHVVSNGSEALEFLESTSCWNDNPTSNIHLSVILMDMEMPVMDGIECTRRVRQAQVDGTINRHIPIISVSANAREAQISGAMSSGMDDAIAKPFRVAELMPRIEKLVRR